ncbi:transglutaminase domain-containing protein [Candidatus Omnitrophota bacterium]
MKNRIRQASDLKRLLFFAFPFILLFISSPTCAALVSTEGKDAGRTKSVLVSSESQVPDLDFVIRQETDRSRDVLISWEDAEFSSAFIVRPRKREAGATLVSRPAALDLKILNIIYEADISSVQDYSRWLKQNIEYKADEGPDIWAQPEDTLTRKYGDCEDFAFLNALVMRIFGYKPKVIGMVGGLIAQDHAVCVFEKDGEFVMFDNATLKQTPASTPEELNRYFFKNYLCAYVMEIRINEAGSSFAAPALNEAQTYGTK